MQGLLSEAQEKHELLEKEISELQSQLEVMKSEQKTVQAVQPKAKLVNGNQAPPIASQVRIQTVEHQYWILWLLRNKIEFDFQKTGLVASHYFLYGNVIVNA